MKKIVSVLLAIMILFSISACGDEKPEESKEELPATKDEITKDEITKDEMITAIGQDAVSTMISKLTPTLKDPNSFEFVSVKQSYGDMDEADGFFVVRFVVNYTATNSFGGRVQDDCYCACWGTYNKSTGKIEYEEFLMNDDAAIFFIADVPTFVNTIMDNHKEK